MQLLQAVEPSCADPMLVIYYISPSSALAMTPMALLDILDEDLRGADLTAMAIAEVAVVIICTGLFSFMLIFSEVRRMRWRGPLMTAGADEEGQREGALASLAAWIHATPYDPELIASVLKGHGTRGEPAPRA